MHNRFDRLGKRLGSNSLDASGLTVVQHEISPNAQHADLRHEPDPRRSAARAKLGLLGRMAALPCLIELYGRAPDGAAVRACMTKHLTAWHQRASWLRKVSRHSREAPFLWIVAAGEPRALLAKLKVDTDPSWPAGVYFFGDDVLRVGFVVASQLRRERSTLLIRLMAGGPLLAPAIIELSKLPADAIERTVADEILLEFQHALVKQPNRTPQEQEFIDTMFTSWEDARAQGHEKGRKEGRKEAQAENLLSVLRARGIAVSATARRRILAEQSEAQLDRWIARASVATSLAEVLDGRARRPARAAHRTRPARS